MPKVKHEPSNNCETCDHKQRPDDGHCWMFRTEPEPVCQQHTLIKIEMVSASNLLTSIVPSQIRVRKTNGPYGL